jgi:hypothetical protein
LDSLVARIRRAGKATAAYDRDAEAAVREDLVVIRDRLAVDRAAEAFGGFAIGELPEATEQTAGWPTREDDFAARFDPDVRAREDRKLVLFFARGGDG